MLPPCSHWRKRVPVDACDMHYIYAATDTVEVYIQQLSFRLLWWRWNTWRWMLFMATWHGGNGQFTHAMRSGVWPNRLIASWSFHSGRGRCVVTLCLNRETLASLTNRTTSTKHPRQLSAWNKRLNPTYERHVYPWNCNWSAFFR